MKKTFYIISLSFLALAFQKTEVSAQQESQFTQYMFNTNAVNPAYAGSRGVISALSLYRTQWVGFDGAPATLMFNVNTPLLNEKAGAGITVINEKIGPTKQTGLFADAVYRIKMKESALAFGLKFGADLFQASFSSLNTITPNDVQFQSNISSKMLPNFGFGMYYLKPRYYLGLSTPRLVQNHISLQDGNSNLSQVSINKMHYYFIAGYIADINPFIKFKPTTQIKFTYGAPVSVDANASFLFFEKFWAGAMYRMGDAVGLLLQYQFNPQFRAGYSYDFTTTKLQKYNNGTHEIMLGYDLSFSKEKIRSPRYF